MHRRGTMQVEHAMNARYCKYAGEWRRRCLQGSKVGWSWNAGRDLGELRRIVLISLTIHGDNSHGSGDSIRPFQEYVESLQVRFILSTRSIATSKSSVAL